MDGLGASLLLAANAQILSSCECRDTWTSYGDGGACATEQSGCPAISCDGGTAGPWCMLKARPCTPGDAGDPRGMMGSYDYDGDPTNQNSWMYCYPRPPAPPPSPPSPPSP